MSWRWAENSMLSVFASTDWQEREMSTPNSSRKPQAAASWLRWNAEVVDDSMIIVNRTIEFSPRGGN